MKKLSTALLATALLTACNSESSAAVPENNTVSTAQIRLTDITGHWAEKSIQTAIQKKFVDGYEDSTFRPEVNVSRAEFLKMIITATNIAVSGETSGSEWYKPYVTAASNAYILRDNDFSDNDMNKPISRLEMSRISLRASDKTLQNKAMQMDDRSILFNATKTGLIQGLSGGELGLDKSTTRAQSVTIIDRVLTVIGGGKLKADKAAQSFAELDLRGNNFETMWGMRVKEFPYTQSVGDGLEMTIHKAVVIDHTDSTSAFFDLYKNGKIMSGQDSYTIAWDISIKNSSVKDHYVIYPVQFLSSIYYGRSYTLTNDLRTLWADQPGEIRGWLGFNKSKKEIDNILASGHSPRVDMEIKENTVDFRIDK